ncbi:MAG: hypothetical protein IJS19_07535, partial [Muribaculaceae bacterium]|nr:hypothetical protein [Muribaculaceae bacterium]
MAQSGGLVHARQLIVKQEYSTEWAHKMEKAATGFVNLVKGLTRLTGEMSEHGQTRENPPLAGEVA